MTIALKGQLTAAVKATMYISDVNEEDLEISIKVRGKKEKTLVHKLAPKFTEQKYPLG